MSEQILGIQRTIGVTHKMDGRLLILFVSLLDQADGLVQELTHVRCQAGVIASNAYAHITDMVVLFEKCVKRFVERGALRLPIIRYLDGYAWLIREPLSHCYGVWIVFKCEQLVLA